jgi:pimeloyl-ACP methyl ester carboxylesterase
VVLLHGLTGSRAYLQPFAERLARTHRVVAIDLPGHGGSDPLEPFSFDAAVSLMAHAVDRIEIERPVVVGHSFGAPLAVAWAAQRPVAGVVACSPIGMIPLELRRARFVLPFHRALAASEPLWGGAAASYALPRRAVFGWFVGMERLDGVDSAMGREMLRDAGRSAPVVRAVMPALASLDLAALCTAVRAPALVIWGDRDRSSWENGPPLGVALGARQCVLPGVGHMPMLEAPYAFTAEVRDFLSATVSG